MLNEHLFLARGRRGLLNLIEGLGEGDVVAWLIVIVLVLVIAGPPIYRLVKAKDASEESNDGRQEIAENAPGDDD